METKHEEGYAIGAQLICMHVITKYMYVNQRV